MKKVSDVFKSIRFAKAEPRGKPHSSTDDEEHGAVGEKEFNQQLQHVKKRAMQEQYREEGRFKPTIPHMVKSKGVGPRPTVDSVKVKLGEDANEDPREYDYEGDMVKSDLRSIIANAQRIIDMVDDEHNFPEWCQNKVTLAEDYISTVANYLTAEMSESLKESGGEVVWKKGDYHIEKYGEDAFGLYMNGKKQKYFQSMADAKNSIKEEVEQIDEENKPTNPDLWARAKSLAKQKFDVYPSAYANGWAAKWYKSKGGGWRSVSEAKEEPPFEPDKPKKKSAVAGKHGAGYSTARHLARMAMKKQSEKMKPMKETIEESRKAEIVKEIVKKKKSETKDKFEANPTMTSEIMKEDK